MQMTGEIRATEKGTPMLGELARLSAFPNRLVAADWAYPDHRRDLAPDRARLPQGNPGTKPVRSAGDRAGEADTMTLPRRLL